MRRLWAAAKIYGLLIVALGALLLLMAQNAQASSTEAQSINLSYHRTNLGESPLLPSSGVTCTLVTTQTTSDTGNHSFVTAPTLSNANNLTLVPPTNVPPGTSVDVQAYDAYYQVNAQAGYHISFDAIPENEAAGNYNLGIDAYNASQSLIQSDTDGSDYSAQMTIVPTYTGVMYFRIYQLNAAAVCSGGHYNIANFTNTGPTPTPSLTPTPTKTSTPTRTITPTPSSTPPFGCQAGVDKFEPNNDFDSATTIGLGAKYDGLNFVQCVYNDGSWDNDYFKVRVKPGMLITCRTSTLSAGTDTNLILYDDNRNGISGNDDVNRAAGDLSSAVTYYVTYEGWLYGLVGQGFNVPQNLEASYTYSYECFLGGLSTDTPTPTNTPSGPVPPTRTPIPTDTPTPTVTPTPTPPFIQIQPLPTATPVGLPLTRIPISLQVYYDANGNNKQDPGEGVSGVSARVFDLVTGNLLAQGFTDDTGRVTFTVSAPGAVHLVVPYFNFSTIVLPSGGSAVIRISPRELPQSIP
jgi:hypothetical protein